MVNDMNSNLQELQYISNCKFNSETITKGRYVEFYAKKISTNFDNLLEDEVMNDLNKTMIEQSESMDKLMNMWGNSLKNLKEKGEEVKKNVRRNVGDVIDLSERLKNAMTKFNNLVDDKKIENIANNLQKITDCFIKLHELSEKGLIDKLKTLISDK